ncbi:hypothetical protein [Acinetobacter shaoyimingii]|uniref:Lipoprotein n=1 Tax=Acinetobacter shaoyimingii TaxID=2715164 RepID=A0A6G8RUR4_9GAMM|nr:hypothetical protein [Acinetobacter shaoyimingii]NHB58199.1 hypothetical protein [Acinetobacter shaoyimingii]QIO05570.1 hypothetical protein G8E00_06190 [Acinetobacter shaoyimingii]
MIKFYPVCLVVLLTVLCGCDRQKKVEQITTVDTSANKALKQLTHKEGFDPESLNKLPLTQKDFPYFMLPEDYKVTSFKVVEYQKYYFAIHDKPTLLEGELYKTPIAVEPSKQFSESYFEKKFNNSMIAMGAELLNESEIPYQLYEQLPDYENQSSLNIGKKTYTYGFRNADGHPIIIQMTLNSPTVVVMEISPDETVMKRVRFD